MNSSRRKANGRQPPPADMICRLGPMRRARKLSGQALGEIAGCTRFQVNRLEKGGVAPDLKLALRLAAALSSPVEKVWEVPSYSELSSVNLGRSVQRDGKTQPELGEFVSFVASVREARGLSVSDLARRADCARQHIIRLEKGGAGPQLALALRLSKILGAQVAELWELSSSDAGDVCGEAALLKCA
jgi:DNA-binding XRE family transcriptional regulator